MEWNSLLAANIACVSWFKYSYKPVEVTGAADVEVPDLGLDNSINQLKFGLVSRVEFLVIINQLRPG